MPGSLVEVGRKILFVTTDQQRYDGLGCNGGTIARTPVIDGLAAEGIRYTRAHCQAVVCMPSRSTMITGQYPRTHGVWMNGVPLPADAPSMGLILCKTRDRIKAEYALRDIAKPIGVAEWQTKLVQSLPESLKGSLPSIEEIEAELRAGDSP